MKKLYLGLIIIFVGGLWTFVCLFADVFGLGPLVFGFGPNSRIGALQLVFIFIGIFIAMIGVAVIVFIKEEKG